MELYKIIREWDEDARETLVDVVRVKVDELPEDGTDIYTTLGGARATLTAELRVKRDAINTEIRRIDAINLKTVVNYDPEAAGLKETA